jgi:clan AA aspartic protease
MHMSAGDLPRPPVFGGNIREGEEGAIEAAFAVSERLFFTNFSFSTKAKFRLRTLKGGRRPKTELVVYCKKEQEMGEVRTEITLVNIRDAGNAQSGFIPESEVRRLTVNAVVDTGAGTLIINDEIREKLGLRVEEANETTLAGGAKVSSGLTEYVEVRWKDRKTPCEALVLPGEEDVLIGALPLEGMDLTINPLRNEVIGAHGDKIRYVVK